MADLSIIVPTYNRASLLRRCVASVFAESSLDIELVVVNGASTDDTSAVLSEARSSYGARLQIIDEPRREGFVRAVNKGFRAARGRNMMWLNDDARPLPGALATAVEQMDHAPATLGLLAIFHAWHSQKNIAWERRVARRTYRLLHVRGTLYANFGIGRRETFERLGYFDERYFLNAADPDFSLKVWNAGLRIEPAWQTAIDHDEHQDDRRASDGDRASADNAKLFAKWDLPTKNPQWNDFDPDRPCTLRGLRETKPSIAA